MRRYQDLQPGVEFTWKVGIIIKFGIIMLMDNVYIYGHHIKPQHFSYSSLDELVARNLGRLPELIAGKIPGETKKQWKSVDEIPADDFRDFNASVKLDLASFLGQSGQLDLDAVAAWVIASASKATPLRKCGLTQWCHLKSKLSGRCSRCMLMNDEVGFQWSTGSYVAYRFFSKDTARAFWMKLAPAWTEVKTAPKKFAWDVGDEVKLLDDVVVSDVREWKYKRGEVLRVYDINEHAFVPAPIPGETLTRVPGTKWSWDWVGYGWIPLEKAELARELP